MFQFKKVAVVACTAGLFACSAPKQTARIQNPDFVKENFANANAMLKGQLEMANPTIDKKGGAFPRTATKDGKMVTVGIYDWTSGFFPGNLWYAYEYDKSSALKAEAARWTEKLEALKTYTDHHDLGFMMYCSYGNGYRLTQNEAYKNILVTTAKSLSTRFNATTGCIKSWNSFKSWNNGKTYNFPVIIDNMMNLELLFFASKVTGDTTYRHIAVTHALTTRKNHFRPDFGSYHVVCYDDATGKVLARETNQGYADNSTWARGQAWGIYGFTMTYRETKDKRFLETAMGLANYFVDNKNLPADGVPYWDFNANQPGFTPGSRSKAVDVKTPYRDASAGAIAASALLELSTYTTGKQAAKYKAAAVKILTSLGSPAYRAKSGTNGNFIIEHCVGNIPINGEVDAPLVYADYYFLEALHRYDRLAKNQPLF